MRVQTVPFACLHGYSRRRGFSIAIVACTNKLVPSIKRRRQLVQRQGSNVIPRETRHIIPTDLIFSLESLPDGAPPKHPYSALLILRLVMCRVLLGVGATNTRPYASRGPRCAPQ